jgi:hypothetical protein
MMVRTLFAIVLGVAVGFCVAALMGWIGDYTFPPPPTVDLNPALARSMAAVMPPGGLAIKLAGWSLGAAAAAWLAIGGAGRGRPLPGWIAAGVLALVAGATTVMESDPLWLTLACVALAAAGGWAVGRLSAARA